MSTQSTADKSSVRERQIVRVTLLGSAVNVVLVALKFVAGFIGNSGAMVADAVHSFSDFLTDIIVLLFVNVSSRPEDSDHGYGHGKYETLASVIVGVTLLIVGCMLLAQGVQQIINVYNGYELQSPGKIALWAALISILLKEIIYRITVSVGNKVHSQAVVANAWHHRSDALSSVATAIGVGGAIFFGDKWTVLDPIAAVLVSIFIIVAASKVCREALDELLEHSLPEKTIKEIKAIVAEDTEVSELHHLRTRRLGNYIAIEMHLRLPGGLSLNEAHRHSMQIEKRLKERFGEQTHVGIHIEPTKINGKYPD